MKKISHIVLLIILFSGCKYDTVQPIAEDKSNYPPEVAKILVTKCASPSCHSDASRDDVGGLDFASWEMLFDGGRNGSSVIPFSPEYSYILYSLNTDTNRGPVLEPTMPYQQNPLTNEEYTTIYNWILNGAKNKYGELRFPDNVNRPKFYICMQGCDKVFVFDAQSKVIMRVVDVGNKPNIIEAPHLVRVSPDGQFWYVVFYSGDVIQKFRTSDDQFVGEVNIGQGDWNTIIFTPDGKKGYVNGTGLQRTAEVNLETMSLIRNLSMDFPHGGFVSPDGNTLYLTCQNGNFINKVNLASGTYDVDPVVLVPGQSPSTSSSQDPHEMVLSPDGSKYFVSCQTSNQIRVFKTSNDSLLAVIPVGTKPQEFALSNRYPYLFVSCTEEPIDPFSKGKVYVISYNTLNIITSIYTGYQPHGIAANDDEGLVYVANLNYDPSGPAPHHSSSCSGRNGYLSMIDMSTLNLYQRSLLNGSRYIYRCELLPFPYFVSYKR